MACSYVPVDRGPEMPTLPRIGYDTEIFQAKSEIDMMTTIIVEKMVKLEKGVDNVKKVRRLQ
jgi:hypothetical protein